MSVDLEAIAQRGRCDVSSLRLAVPLLEQGYTPPFLARYRRDELGGLDESSLWALSSALQNERQVAQRREELHQAWQQTSLRDPALGHAISKANSLRMLARLGRRLKSESSDAVSDSTRLAVRLLNPQKGDGDDLAAIAARVEGITSAEAAVAGVEQELAKRLAGDPRIIGAAVRWLVKHARIHIASIRDPHTSAATESSETPTEPSSKAASKQTQPPQESTTETSSSSATDTDVAAEASQTGAAATSQSGAVSASDSQTGDATAAADAKAAAEATAGAEGKAVVKGGAATESGDSEQASAGPDATQDDASQNDATQDNASEASASTSDQAATESSSQAASAAAASASSAKPKQKAKSKEAKKKKKVSPRQRRRRWLVGVLKPLEGKRLSCDKLSSFQIVMLGRALRSQVAECSFEYDATKLVAELQRVAAGINRRIEEKLRAIVLEHEAQIREAAESAWWDDLHERASSRLVSIAADHLRQHVNRGSVEAKVVMAIDAVGPRTAASAIVSADGRLLHSEDIPCQLSAALRSQAVARIGELIHTYHVDLLIVSNGPARRATMIALGDLIAQSPENSVRWTLADRSGADAYAGSAVANDEMRSTPRRFRAAAWLAFAVLQPAQALAKVDPLKLRLSSFQRELSDDAMSDSFNDVMVSGASRGGVDVNSAPVSWLLRLPGLTEAVAEAIDANRRQQLFDSRDSIRELDQWNSSVDARQAIPFLRVFGSQESLDGTLIDPDDYPLAKKLASALDIELPPDAPPGYTPPDFNVNPEPAEPAKLAETTSEPEKIKVEDFTAAGTAAADFSVDPAPAEADAEQTGEADRSSDGAGEPTSQASTPAESAASEPIASESPSAATVNTDSATEQPAADQQKTAESSELSAASSGNVAGGGSESSPDSESSSDSSPEQSDSSSEQSDVPPAAADGEATPPASTSVSVEIPDPIRRPRPEQAKIDKCVKEWQIGARRARQLVHWLCDPFGDSDAGGNPPAVMTTMPTVKNLKPGDPVIGVAVGVMPFGVFVELAPDCSGLIHVSRVSDSYVEDLHEAVQVGDVMTAWVTGIDERRRRVALTAVSPEREAELEDAKRRSREQRPQRGGPRRRGSGDRPGGGRGGKGGGQAGTASRGGADRGQAAPSRGKQATPAGQARGKDQGRSGRSREGSRGGRSGGTRGGKGRGKKPESYRVVSKQEAQPISDAMQKGEEPLRSFGDLMQFYGKATKEEPKSSLPAQPQTPESSGSDAPAEKESSAEAGRQPSAAGEDAAGQTPVETTTTESGKVPASPSASGEDPGGNKTEAQQANPKEAEKGTNVSEGGESEPVKREDGPASQTENSPPADASTS